VSAGLAPLHSDSPFTTEDFGAALGAVLGRGDLLVLEGPLGAGKTCLVRGIVAGAGGDPAAVRSPTFVLHQPHRGTSVTVHHIDLYRLGPGASIDVLDVDALLADGAVVVEWGGYADLGHLGPATVSISACADADDHRLLHLAAAAHAPIASAWRALEERLAVP
jgi:tRNA threonylcarbamoyl adenosine modification protein YjeE